MCLLTRFYLIPGTSPLRFLPPPQSITDGFHVPLMSSPLILVYKVSGKTDFLEHFLNPFRFGFMAIVISLAQINSLTFVQVWMFLTLTDVPTIVVSVTNGSVTALQIPCALPTHFSPTPGLLQIFMQ